MKKLFFFSVITLMTLTGFAQNKKGKNANSAKREIELDIYDQSIKYGDVGAAVNSLYILIVRHPENIAYKDSLARIYFQVGSYNQCLNVCNDLKKVRPDDTTMLRMMAMSYQSLGYATEAIAEFEKIVKLTGNVFDIYQKAALEYRIKRLQESKISVELVLSKVQETDKITLFIDQDNKQEVPLKAAAFNLYGMIAKDFNDTASARFLFNEAIKLYPDFYFANANIKLLNDAANKKPEPIAEDPMPAATEKKKGK